MQLWPQTDLDQILLSLYELMKFAEYVQGGIQTCYLDASSTLPTTLHSAGNQLYPCKCGCRPALSIQRLQKRGLYGVLIPMGSFVRHENQWWEECRYPHPQELFYLNGGLPSFDFSPDLRLGMAGVGQCVSPIQGLWIFSHIGAHLARFLQTRPIDPVNALTDYLAALIQARDSSWTLPPQPTEPGAVPEADSRDQDDGMQEFCVPDAQGCEVRFKASPHVTIGEFRIAEETLHGIQWPVQTIVNDWQINLSDEVVIDSIPFPVPIHNPAPVQDVVLEEEGSRDSGNRHASRDSSGLNSVSSTLPFTVHETPQVSDPSSLLSLKGEDFLCMHIPAITSCEAVQVLRLQTVTQQDRIAILDKQQGLWADDEIVYCMQHLCLHGPSEQQLLWWDPIILTHAINTGDFELLHQAAASLPQYATVLTAVVIEKHWHPLVWRIDASGVFAYTCGLVQAYSLAHQALHRVVCEARNVEVGKVHNPSLCCQ